MSTPFPFIFCELSLFVFRCCWWRRWRRRRWRWPNKKPFTTQMNLLDYKREQKRKTKAMERETRWKSFLARIPYFSQFLCSEWDQGVELKKRRAIDKKFKAKNKWTMEWYLDGDWWIESRAWDYIQTNAFWCFTCKFALYNALEYAAAATATIPVFTSTA